MFGKRKTPSVRIPASVLKKEAERMAKKMRLAEEKKEKTRLKREKIKEKAKQKNQRRKEHEEHWNDFYDSGVRCEFIGGGWILVGIIVFALFFSNAEISSSMVQGLENLFGLALWSLPLISFLIGGAILYNHELHFPPLRVLALLTFFISSLGLIHLSVPLEDSSALAYTGGGIIGFTVSFFPREFFGEFVAGLFMIMLLWGSAVLGFRLQFFSFLKWCLNQYSNREKPNHTSFPQSKKAPKKQSATFDADPVPTPEEVVESSVEIVDSRSSYAQDSKNASSEDPLTEAKNRSISGVWEPPSLDILNDTHSKVVIDESQLRDQADTIREKLEQFGIEVVMKSVHVGPTVTQFTLEPAPGIKLTKITSLKSDIALALAAHNVRIEAPIRGKKLVGIEIPNEKRTTVGMREILESEAWAVMDSPLKLALGRNVAGVPLVADLASMPHLLIAGKTGSGKSVAMNAFLMSLLWSNAPDNLRMILIDPKRVELTPYNNLPHLLTPIIVEPEKSVSALAWAVAEMNRRFKDFSAKKVRNIGEHNENYPEEKEPFIVVVIDELADLMMVAGKDCEAAICRIAQLGRAAGIHLVIATQRPSVDVVTGLIKANLPARIAFRVSSGIDSRTIIDGIGAEDLLGFGDMLSLDGNSGELTRIQGLYLDTAEIERVTNHIKLQFPEVTTNDEITSQSIEGMAKGGVLTAGVNDGSYKDEDLDDLYQNSVQLITETGKASASFLQRRLEIGYARAARILDQMESRGVIGPAKGAKPREIFGLNQGEE